MPDDKWTSEVPGARFFRADLHVHTLDDHPSPNFVWPDGISGDPSDPDVQTAYGRALLRAASDQHIEVLGLTPHSARSSAGAESATWRVVEIWSTEADSDGVPFREKIRCVFPGFEISGTAGSDGLHFLFLFDPSVSKATYLQAFDALMQGREPWLNGSVQNSPRNTSSLFDEIRALSRTAGFDFLVVCPHAFSNKGLFNALKSQVLGDFRADQVAALELQDHETALERLEKAPEWQRDGFTQHRHALIHASDAYALTSTDSHRGIGYRHSLIKLAAPSIEALRQAFLANDSRIRCCYSRTSSGLELDTMITDGISAERAWLRSLTVAGGSSFFGRQMDGSPRTERFSFSPDLTCVIGGRLTGKSTLLDGLREHFGAPMPDDSAVRRDITDRAKRFRGDASVSADIIGEWTPQFFTQRELQGLARDDDALTGLVFGFSTVHRDLLRKQRDDLRTFDRSLEELVAKISQSTEAVGVQEQLLAEANDAKTRLETLVNAGVNDLWAAQRDVAKATTFGTQGKEIEGALHLMQSAVDRVVLPTFEVPGNAEEGTSRDRASSLAAIQSILSEMAAKVTDLLAAVAATHARAAEIEAAASQVITNDLVANGQGPDEIGRYEALRATALQVDGRLASLNKAREEHKALLDNFENLEKVRGDLLLEHRALVDEALGTMNARLEGRVQITRLPETRHDALERWLLGFKKQGLTRWWNSSNARPDPTRLRAAASADNFSAIGMTTAVSESFKEVLTAEAQLMLRALRSEDSYRIEMNVGAATPEYRELLRLSGGAQVSTLLTVLLEADDGPPLVVDQPEDEIDSAFLWDTILPALRRLKGRRQIIFATHDANVVVNGDADMVIQLQAESDRGWIGVAGAIEDADVRSAIVATVDGGRTAFDLRRTKYGF